MLWRGGGEARAADGDEGEAGVASSIDLDAAVDGAGGAASGQLEVVGAEEAVRVIGTEGRAILAAADGERASFSPALQQLGVRAVPA
eukprot:6249766-Prymnesium_polylepis.1